MALSSSNELAAAAHALCGQQHYPTHCLYVVATPIGNRGDISLRAWYTLSLMDAIACEDTRNSANLLQSLGLHKPLVAVHEHNEHSQTPLLVARLQAGERIACISDAGTPGISDPGAHLVAAVRAAGLRIIPLPGACAAVTALSASGVPAGTAHAQGFVFAGFLPSKGRERLTALQAWIAQAQAAQHNLVIYEAPHRMADLARQLADLPPLTLTLARELSKQFEHLHTLPSHDLAAWLAEDAQRLRGEFALVLHPSPVRAATADAGDLDEATRHTLTVLLDEGLPVKQAVALAARLSGAPRNALYSAALALRQA
ncbi:16S rRNA (cytidine(1402)-2'-O)-methyltransferase [Amphibiibacter pelophylacis]|uniref:16S rRNA (Cytidine(1402)-2'-O)-methyltransferase n=1 Tax=Amphibiibacter pelophylacis TaxID=1799477 RepID=A0ACC6P1H0_9BURK